ncbi:MAG: PVC-type heme-binding CxxCH protein [Rhodothermales bacterium]
MKTTLRIFCAVLFLTFTICLPLFAQQETVDRDYTLSASILGYKGIGGDIDGVRNPVLTANKGETVRITIVNLETLTHDLVMENAGVRTDVIVDAGARTSVTFTAAENDTYFCSVSGHRQAGMEGSFQIIDLNNPAITGLPVVQEGRALNLGFEEGTLRDWTAEGEAFGAIPVEGDVLILRTGDTRSNHTGSFWMSSIEENGHRAKGTLSSVPFKITQPYASFQVAGGALAGSRVELVDAQSNEVFFKISGHDNESMRPVVVDLQDKQSDEMFIRLVDDEDGVSGLPYIRDNKLAYISFDEFQFYSQRPTFPNEFKTSDIYIMPAILEVPHAGLNPQKAAEAMEVPEGFKITLAAAEPDVVRPITFTHDDKGRLWVVEAHTYPVPAPEGEGRDRILIFEDTNGDGVLDSRKVFIEGLNLVSGMELGFGGVWVGAAPYLLFIPRDGDKPAGPPEIRLDGWGTRDTHETLNSLRWGPDGWLYGNQGVFTPSNVGVPGTPENERVALNGGVWRYHPTRTDFELYAEGTSNPWGIDFNDFGHPFITVCVIPHLFHVIPGARYERQAYEHFNPYTYDDIKTHGDHLHWVGERGPHAGNHRSDEVGGGHAHAGAMFYQGGSWPEKYHDQLFMNNIHGYRANVDAVVRDGSGYVGQHGEDFLFANDSWSQMLNFKYGPDGSVHVIDWYDKNQCHSPNPDVHDKTLGRIYKITHENDQWVQVDLQSKSNEELAELQLHKNEWYVRHARRILQERGADKKAHKALEQILKNNTDIPRRLRALWALYVSDGISDAALVDLLSDESDMIRSWAVQLIADDKEVSDAAMQRFAEMAHNDPSATVRLYLASAMQRVDPDRRWDVMAGLSTHAEDANDHNLPLMVWYAAEPMVPMDMNRALDLALAAELPRLLTYTIQRIAAVGTPEALQVLARHLEETPEQAQQKELLKGLNTLVGGTDE